ncbi:MAG: hypothetical protein COA78_06005 [Blastopirellula sp.]|nr:MAG: hypothetical protein COA78_06005 [Blastopirellula sp.]
MSMLTLCLESTQAQDSLLNSPAFDRLIVLQKTGEEEFKVVPISFPNGTPPVAPNPVSVLTLELVSEPGKKYEVKWRDIKKYEQFGNMLLAEANEVVAQKKFDLAYLYFERLLVEYPKHKGLPESIEEYQVQNAFALYQQNEFNQALGILDGVREKSPQRAGIDASISRVADKIVEDYIAKDRYDAAFTLIQRYQATNQAARFPFVAKWIKVFTDKAEALRVKSKASIDAGDPRTAYDLAKEMLRIYPKFPGGIEYFQEIVRKYPLLQVGTTSVSTKQPSLDSLTWSGSRDRRLFYRTLSEVIGYGAEGGEYASPYGSLVRGIDGRSIDILLRSRLTSMSGFDLSRQILNKHSVGLSPITEQFRRIVDQVYVENILDVHVTLSQTHIRPESLLRFIPQLDQLQETTNGPYRFLEQEAEITRYVLQKEYPWKQPLQPVEIVHQRYESTRQAIADLRSGKIDLIDRLFPGNVAALQDDESLVVNSYRAPTMHVLVPNYENPYLANRNFRRALVYAINRQNILTGRLLSGGTQEGTQVISAPIPAGINNDDPLAYGYNPAIDIRPYEPQMAVALIRLTEIELAPKAKEKEEGEEAAAEAEAEAPALGTLILGHPDSEISREAVEPIVQFLKRVGITCELKVIDAEITNPVEAEVDLLYAEIHIEEPLVDVPILFRRYVAQENLSPAFRLGLRELGRSRNWEQVRNRFNSVHRLAYDELPILPLWQIHDHFAYSKTLNGVTYQPVNLYQSIEKWETTPRIITSD